MKTKVAIKFLKGVEKHRSGFSRLASNGFVESKSQPFPTSYTWLAAQLTLLLLLKLLFDVHFITFRWPMTNSNHWQRWSGHDIPKFELWLGKHNKKNNQLMLSMSKFNQSKIIIYCGFHFLSIKCPGKSRHDSNELSDNHSKSGHMIFPHLLILLLHSNKMKSNFRNIYLAIQSNWHFLNFIDFDTVKRE